MNNNNNNIDLDVELKDDLDTIASTTINTTSHSSSIIKCRYWPNCSKSDCTFYHPTENCKYFPNCKYGEQCLYIHPNYNNNYSNKSNNNNTNSNSTNNVKMSPILCRYGIECTRMDCKYQHKLVGNFNSLINYNPTIISLQQKQIQMQQIQQMPLLQSIFL